MVGVREDLIVSLAGIDAARMLEFWRWLIPETHRPLFASALGDLFLAEPDGGVVWLDMGVGQLEPVATTESGFERAVIDPENRSYWFGESLVDQLRTSGRPLRPGECYSYLQLPMLGGAYDPVNFRIYDVETHFRVWGPIHEQLRDIPESATVVFELGQPKNSEFRRF